MRLGCSGCSICSMCSAIAARGSHAQGRGATTATSAPCVYVCVCACVCVCVWQEVARGRRRTNVCAYKSFRHCYPQRRKKRRALE